MNMIIIFTHLNILVSFCMDFINDDINRVNKNIRNYFWFVLNKINITTLD